MPLPGWVNRKQVDRAFGFINASVDSQIYGFLASDPYVFLANGSGVFLGMFFVLSSQALAPPPTRHTIERLVFFVLTVLVSMGVTAAYVVHGDMDVRASVVGTAAATMNVIMFSNPLAIMVTVCKTKNPSALSIPLCITSTCCASLWSTYAIAVADIFIFIANFPGVVVGIIQVIVIAIYRRSGDGMAGSKSQVAYSLPHDIEVPPAEDDLGGTHGTPHAGVIMAPISGRSTM
eukprot:jgi/Mesvir1/27177/Mv18965-RA.1